MNFHVRERYLESGKSRQIRPALFTFFAGAGFLDLGFEKAGFEVQFVNEFHEPFMKAYKFSRSRIGIEEPKFGYHCGDISNILNDDGKFQQSIDVARTTNELVGFVGGPPCPDFSVGGKNRGKIGENGKLSLTYIDLICKFKPDFFVFENVKGLWKTKKHRKFYDELKSRLACAGYVLSDRLINAIEYGSPQDRDRIILVGILKSVAAVSDPASLFPWNTGVRFDRSILKSGSWPDRDPFEIGAERKKGSDVPEEITVQHWFDRNNVKHHENFKDCFTPRAALKRFLVIDEGDDSKKCFKRLHRWRYSPTVAYGNNEVHLHPFEARRINVAEALALQSLPQEFCLPVDMTLTDKFKTIGNGVPFLAASGIAAGVLNWLEAVWQPN
jgi:DNA (cytosine-5)-methyltransferase 1